MKAWVLENINNYNLKEIEEPVLAEGQVLVNVKACGICGSDIPRAFQNGAHKMPLIIGHEFAGEVVSVSKDADKFKSGDRVGIFPLIPCKKCGPCSTKKYEMCRNYNYLGSRCDGGFAEMVAVPEWNLIKLPDNVSFKAAAMLEPMAVAVHAMRQLLPVGINSDSKIAIYGLGTIGLLLALFLRDAGIKNIYAIGNKDFQLETFEKLGFNVDNFCDSRKTDVDKWIMSITDNKGMDGFFECIGKSETISQSVDLTAPGGSICFVGNPFSDVTFPKNTYWKILRNQLKISGTWNSSFTHEDSDDWHYVLDRVSKGSINPELLITHEFAIEDIYQGFEIMCDKKEDYIKIMMCR